MNDCDAESLDHHVQLGAHLTFHHDIMDWILLPLIIKFLLVRG